MVKAESIEQIREHLARGGRVVNDEGESVWKVVEYLAVETCNGGMIVPSQFDEKDWQLLPLEENEPVDHGTQTSDDTKGSPVGWTIVAIGEVDGSVLCQAPNGKRRRYWLMDHGTQKGPASVGQIEMRLNKRIRTRLLHGHWPAMQDLLDWWEATTGERIEHGKRCERCEGSGKSPDFRVQCGVCQGSGYSVRPTWMERQGDTQ